MKQFKCSMNKKIESLAKKSEGVGGEEAYLDFEDAVKLVLMDKYGVVDSHGPSDETANSLVLQYGATLRDAFNKGGNGGYSPESEALYIITDRLHEAPHFFDDCKNFKFKAGESKKNEKGTTKIETYVGFDELLGYADAEYLLEDVVDVLSKYYTYEDETFDEDQAEDDPEFTIKIEGGDERADFYSEDIFYVHLPNKEAAEELAKVLGGELSESKKPESCKDGKKESMERCDSCGAVMTEYDYDRYGGLCKHCRDKGEAKRPAESSKQSEASEDALVRKATDFIMRNAKRANVSISITPIDNTKDYVGFEIDGVTVHGLPAYISVYFNRDDGSVNNLAFFNNDLDRGSDIDILVDAPIFEEDPAKVFNEFLSQADAGVKGESRKKSEGIGDRIKMGIDYNMFMRMCRTAAYLDEDEDYWDALWEYYSESGEISDALEFFDNLFQYTAWCDADEVYDEYLDDKFKDESKSKEECIDAAIDDGDLQAYKHEKGNYLVIL